MKIKRALIYFVFLFLLIFISFEITHATSFKKPFGGTIIKTKATQIETLENSGWTCTVAGETIEIKPISSKYPTSYMIPANVQSSTKNKLSENQKIIGNYLGKTIITCVRSCPPAECVTTTSLDTVTMYGNSNGTGSTTETIDSQEGEKTVKLSNLQKIQAYTNIQWIMMLNSFKRFK